MRISASDEKHRVALGAHVASLLNAQACLSHPSQHQTLLSTLVSRSSGSSRDHALCIHEWRDDGEALLIIIFSSLRVSRRSTQTRQDPATRHSFARFAKALFSAACTRPCKEGTAPILSAGELGARLRRGGKKGADALAACVDCSLLLGGERTQLSTPPGRCDIPFLFL